MASDGGEGGQEGAQWALRFISGKYQGGEFLTLTGRLGSELVATPGQA